MQGASRRRHRAAALRPALPLTQLLVLALLLLSALLACLSDRSQVLISVSNLVCLGVVAVCLSAYCLAKGGANSLFDSLLPFVLGAASLIGACYWSMVAMVSGHEGLGWQLGVLHQWIGLACVLLVILVVFAFGRQMLRLNRTNVISGLSESVVNGLVCICVSGWAFLPSLTAYLASGLAAGLGGWRGRVCLAVLVLFLALVAGLCMASWDWWSRGEIGQGRLSQTWLAVSLLPVMIAGALVAVALYCLQAVL
ncbi:hypothetical protein CRD59_06870 [Bifidobacterium xylocopae]|uniref:Uncharacterized protein n=2 Tax=Bifidobacterium xylocopae TaxID=2493119 RepID=A0A366KCD8_9BIFI|nr:hypothetical protein CRD59_06870 [Bifidobacterium xylocopae]